MVSSQSAPTSEVFKKTPWQVRRCLLAIVFLILPLALLFGSFAYGLVRPRDTGIGLWCMLPASLIALLNVYLSWIRPAIHFLVQGSMTRYRFASGIPAIGTFLILTGGLLGFGNRTTALTGIVLLLLDTGGLPWFVVATLNDRSCFGEGK
jgi:hypothetical protein